jgi:hypothetical protein
VLIPIWLALENVAIDVVVPCSATGASAVGADVRESVAGNKWNSQSTDIRN